MLDFGKNENTVVDVRIINAAGVIVKAQRQKLSGVIKWNIEDVAAGVYQLQVLQNGKAMLTKALTIIK